MLHTNNLQARRGLTTSSSRRKRRIAIAAIAAVAVTLAMAVVPILMTSSTTTIVQSAWAQEIPDASSLIEQYDVSNAGELVEEHGPVIPAIPENLRHPPLPIWYPPPP